VGGDGEGLAQRLVVENVRADATAVIADHRLDGNGVADLVGGLKGLVKGATRPTAGHRNAGIAEHLPGPVLVVGNAVADQIGTTGDRSLDALLPATVAELDVAAVFGQAEVGNVAPLGGIDDRGRGGPQHVFVAYRLQAADDRQNVDIAAMKQTVDDIHCLDAGREATGFVTVTIDDVVDAGVVAVDGLAVAHREADQVLQLDRHMLDDMSGPGAALQAFQKAAGTADRTAMFLEARQEFGKARHDAGHGVTGPLLKLADVQAHEDRQVATVVVRAAQRTVLEDLHGQASNRALSSLGAR
jgi:hypothetical protein